MAYRIIKAPGGTWHIHPGGKRTWHPAAAIRNAPPGRAVGPAGMGPRTGGRAVGFVVPRRPAAPLAGAAPGAAPGAPAGPAEFAPDSTYFSDLARQRHGVQQALTGYDREDADDRTASAESMRRFNEQEPLAQQNANEGFNRQGLFYSGQLGQEKARLSTQYARTRADMQAAHRGREQARLEARRALEAGASVEEAASLASAVDRGIDRDSEAADNNALVPNVPQAPPPINPAPYATPRRPAAPRQPTRQPTLRKPTVPRSRPVVRDPYRGTIGGPAPQNTRSPTRRRRRTR